MEICLFFSYNSTFSNYELISQQWVQLFADTLSTNSVTKSIDTIRYPYHSLNLAPTDAPTPMHSTLAS